MKIKLSTDTLIIFLLLIFVFQSPIANCTSGVISEIINGLDEIVAILLICIAIFKRKVIKIQCKILLFQISLLLVGVIGTIINNFQPLNGVVQDIINCSKFSFALVGIISIYKNKNYNELIDSLQKYVRILTIIFFLLAVISQFIKIPGILYTSKRFGVYALQLFYYHPAIVAQIMTLFLAILSIPSEKLKNKNLLKTLCIIMLCMTLRTRAICFAVVYLIIWNYKWIKNSKGIKYICIVCTIMGAIFLAQDSINTYYGSMESSARGRLTIGSIKIAKDFFPVGGGFATYGTSTAINYYSKFYEEFGFRRVYGLGYVNTSFATDTFWPAVIGEFGILGLVIYIMFIIYLVKIAKRLLDNNSRMTFAYITLLVYLLICTSSGTGFFNPISVPYGIIMGISILSINKNKDIEKGEN